MIIYCWPELTHIYQYPSFLMLNRYIYYCATAVIKNTALLIKPNDLSTLDTSLICLCHKDSKLKWANCFVNTLASHRSVRQHLSGLVHVQAYLCCHSILRAGIKSRWLEIPVLPQWPTAWEREETGRRPHTEDVQVSLLRYVAHMSTTHTWSPTVHM